MALSWGTDQELLVGSNALRLFQTAVEEVEIWSRELPKPVKLATFSYDASLIATTGRYDRLIKLWRRQASGADDTRFDYTYLPHPTAVTAIQWRRPHARQQALNHVLHSVCGDQKVRIWAAMDPHGVQGLQLWAEIDMQASIQPRQPDPEILSQDRFAFIVDSQDLSDATAMAVKRADALSATDPQSEQHHALGHLIEIAKSSPELCVVVDRHGHMSAWGLENVGCKTKKPTDVFNVAHVENFFMTFPRTGPLAEGNAQFLAFCGQQANAPFTILAHYFDGRIEWHNCRLDDLLDPSPQTQRTHNKNLWAGHDGSIKKLVRSVSGKAVISRTNDNNASVWKQGYNGNDLGLTPYASLHSPEHIVRSWLFGEGDFVVNLHHHSISLWDARCSPASQIQFLPFDVEGQLTCLIQLPERLGKPTTMHLATVTSKKKGIVWAVCLPTTSHGMSKVPLPDKLPGLTQTCTFDLNIKDDITFMLPIDPAGSNVWTSCSLDTFARDIAISYSSEGKLRSWTAALDTTESAVEWLNTSTVDTGIDAPCLASASSTRKVALIDASNAGLTIWDLRSGQLEHHEHYGDADRIQDLDWSSTPDNQALLAVGFPHKVVILTQMRYDYLSTGPAWAPLREIYIRDSTPHPIGDSTWLGSGSLLVGAGNQLFAYDKMVDSSDDMVSDLTIPVHQKGSMNLFDLVTFLNGPLPLFHPQFLSQCILAGKMFYVHQISRCLHKAVKFFTDGDELDSHLSLSPEDCIMSVHVSHLNMHFTKISLMDTRRPHMLASSRPTQTTSTLRMTKPRPIWEMSLLRLTNF